MKQKSGFTFITLSIILTVASLLFVATLPGIQTSLKSSAASVTKMNSLLNTMRGYMAANGVLPCPADPTLAVGASNYGVAAANPGTGGDCIGGTPAAAYVDTTNNIAIGMVPVKTLGLSYADALDAFGRDITYAVDTNATATCWASSSLTGAITVNDNGINYNTVAVLVSHGADGYGAWLPLSGTSGTASRFDNGSTDTSQAANAQVATGGGLTALTSGNFVSFVRKAATSTFDDSIVYKSNQYTLNNLPTSSQVYPAITPPSNGTYTTGNVLTFTITYASNVTVTGTPRLDLSALGGGSIGTGNVAYATYQSGSGTTALTFSYTVQAADSAPTSGIQVASSIDLNGGTLSGGSTCFTAPNLSGVLIGLSCPLYRTVTIDHTKVGTVNNTDQTNFPLLFAGTYSYLATVANGGKVANANGYDIKFTSDSAGTILLNYEQESYNSTTGAVNYWVKIPTLSHTADTVIYLQYCTANQTNQSNAAALWTTGNTYQLVDHYGTGVNGASPSLTDSSGTFPTGHGSYAWCTPTPASVTSPFGTGGGVSFNNPSYNGWCQYVGWKSNDNNLGVGDTNFTVETWVQKLASSGFAYNTWVFGAIAAGGSDPSTTVNTGSSSVGLSTTSVFSNSTSNNCPTLFLNSSGNVSYRVPSTTCPALSTWYHVAATKSGTSYNIYVNGVNTTTGGANFSGPSTLSNNGNGGRIGYGDDGTPGEVYMDEVRFSTTAYSADWIKTEYNNQSSPSTFYTVGAPTSR